MIKTKIYISLLFFAIASGAIGCNPGIIEVPPPQVTDASAYFWKTNSQVSFLDSNIVSKSVSPIYLNFPQGDSASSFLIKESRSSFSDTLTCILGSEDVSISGLSVYSIIPLADGYSIKPQSTKQKDTVVPPFNHILALSGSSVIASNDSGIYLSKGSTWVKISQSSLKLGETVTLFAASGSRIYAATSQGLLNVSSNGGNTWSLLTSKFYPNKILALAPDPSTGYLFISVNNHVFKLSGTIVDTLQSFLNLQFTSLAYLAADSSRALSVLVGGTNDRGLYYRQFSPSSLDSDWSAVSGVSTKNIRSLVAASPDVGVFCSAGKSIDSSSDGIFWNVASANDTGMLVYDVTKANVISWTKQGQFQYVAANTTKQIPQFHPRSINDFSAADGNYFVATDSGIYSDIYPNTNWNSFSSGLGISSTRGSDIPGSIVLLHSHTGGISPDSSWLAGTLVNTNQNMEFPITARIIGHLDQVTMPDSTKYPDVIEVQYSYEVNSKPSTIPPYWLIYYAKGIGPIIIDEVSGTVFTHKIYRRKF